MIQCYHAFGDGYSSYEDSRMIGFGCGWHSTNAIRHIDKGQKGQGVAKVGHDSESHRLSVFFFLILYGILYPTKLLY